MRISRILFTVSIVTLTLVSPCVYAEITTSKTPNNVYAKVMFLRREVEIFRKDSQLRLLRESLKLETRDSIFLEKPVALWRKVMRWVHIVSNFQFIFKMEIPIYSSY